MRAAWALCALLCLPAAAQDWPAGLPAPSGKPVDGGRHAVLKSEGPLDPKRTPLVLVHGLLGSRADLEPVAAKLRGKRYQLLWLEYDDFARKTAANGADLAEELQGLRHALGDGRQLVIVAHSMGGVVTRAALNALGGAGDLTRWKSVRAVCVDTPWHGFPGPPGEMPLPGAIDDMRARSPVFEGGLTRKPLPSNAEVELFFAQEGDAALDYTEPPLDRLPEKLARYYSTEEPVRGEARLMNFWGALIWSSKYEAFESSLRAKDSVSPEDVRAALLKYYPRFPGDHTGVLRREGAGSLSERLVEELRP